MRYIEVDEQAARKFFSAPPEGPVVMLNLLRFRETADYAGAPDLAPAEPISGREAYQRYADHTAPFLAEAGSEVLFAGDGGNGLIGPPDERWDLVLLVRHPSAKGFLAFASNEAYLQGLPHRTAALEDSRLFPVQPTPSLGPAADPAPDVTGPTLVMSIQAVDQVLHQLEAELDAVGNVDDQDPDLQELHLSYWKAAQNLQDVYERVQARSSNLPPYEQLVHERDPRSPKP